MEEKLMPSAKAFYYLVELEREASKAYTVIKAANLIDRMGIMERKLEEEKDKREELARAIKALKVKKGRDKGDNL